MNPLIQSKNIKILHFLALTLACFALCRRAKRLVKKAAYRTAIPSWVKMRFINVTSGDTNTAVGNRAL